MITEKAAHSYKNGRSNGHNGHPRHAKKMTLVSYLGALRLTVVKQFRADPFGLDEKDAEKCANEVMKVIERNHKRARHAGFIID